MSQPRLPPVLEIFQLPIHSQLLPKHFARYTIDGGVTRVTDKAGKVQFAASRGKHHLLIQAAGYQSFDIEVTV